MNNTAILNPLAFIGDGGNYWPDPETRIMRCPVCRYEYLHPTAVLVDRGGDVVRIDSEGIDTYSYENKISRGVITTLRFCCEAGHVSELRLSFHKGNTFMSAVDPTEGVVLDEPAHWPATIWRD